jgi:signal transduction histidine kinase
VDYQATIDALRVKVNAAPAGSEEREKAIAELQNAIVDQANYLRRQATELQRREVPLFKEEMTAETSNPELVDALRNELTVILGQCGMLEDAFATEPDSLARINSIKAVALRMADKISH